VAAGYLVAASGPASAEIQVDTVTTLTAFPNPVPYDATVNLTATVQGVDGSYPAGYVQFQLNGTDIGEPAPVGGGEVATGSAAFTVTGSLTVTAVFTPTDTMAYAGSTGAYLLTVTPADGGGNVPITTTVPQSGAFVLTITPGTVNLAVSGSTATGTLQDVTVSDSRNYYPGWSVSGQSSSFTGAGAAAGSTIR
jgi:hypothetical protein